MMRLMVRQLLLGLMLSLQVFGADKSESFLHPEEQSRALCGVHSTYIALHLVGIKIDYPKVRGAFPDTITSSGVSIAGIEEALGLLGAPYLSVKMNFSHLSTLEGLVGIAWHPPQSNGTVGHFFAVRCLDENRVLVIDPPHDPYVVSEVPKNHDEWLPVILLSKKGDFSEYAILFRPPHD